MATLDPGVYVVLSGIDQAITLRPSVLDWSAVEIPVKGIASVGQPKWRVSDAGPEGSNLRTITLAGEDQFSLVVKNNLLFISTAPATQFSIEAAGVGIWRVHIPNEDSVWRLDAVDQQVKTASADGSENELWIFNLFVPPGPGPSA